MWISNIYVIPIKVLLARKSHVMSVTLVAHTIIHRGFDESLLEITMLSDTRVAKVIKVNAYAYVNAKSKYLYMAMSLKLAPSASNFDH